MGPASRLVAAALAFAADVVPHEDIVLAVPSASECGGL
jgi:hypothetical protein